MLKRKLYKVCLISGSFIFMAVSSGSRSVNKKTGKPLAVEHRTGMHHFDSSGLCTCIPFTLKEELAHAPRIQLNKNAAPFVKGYIKKNGFFLGKTKNRNTPYFAIMDSVFEQCELPLELKYLSFVESGLKLNPVSRSGAIGPWALMPKAAKQYGLKIGGKKDERLNYYKSTEAAAGLLSDLFDKYGDWLLVIAAYNCGPGGVQKAIKKSGSRNYWVLQNFLPEETRKHVKKFIAVHYYFEGHGGVTTLTKAETETHIKAVAAFVKKQQEMEKTDSLSVVVVK
ncbi:MAG TPA: lytic transglycosylase domain-containing protein [Chitinophagaceae bacterium]|nr:lytic transglycosylase domain-containing protein [Chitinophagaceae bacterium]